VSNETAYLNGKDKVIGGRFPPGNKSLLGREVIKTVIKLYGAKFPGVKSEPS